MLYRFSITAFTRQITLNFTQLQSAEQVNYSSVTFAVKSILGFERTPYVEITLQCAEYFLLS